ncbi:cutinase family protein [Embleya sp. NPDC008237]|uniref:cutinase family protein n=1 Tax=Embleya sp. NPDC008237 TaxID=3363978 RepID=UPI0036F00F89
MSRTRTAARFAAVATAAVMAAGTLTVTSGAAAAAADSCADIDVTYAMGTQFGVSGPPDSDPVYDALVAALDTRLAGTKTVSYYRVNYPASLEPWSASVGNWDLVRHIKAQAAACPNQTFAAVGYSQGANVVSNSVGVSSLGSLTGAPIVAVIPANIEPRVTALVVYGSPQRGMPLYKPTTITGTYQARTLDDCATGDPACGGGADPAAHLSYSRPEHSVPAADFIAARS